MTVSRLIGFATVLRMSAEALMQGLQDDPAPGGENREVPPPPSGAPRLVA
jgi:hypothetical protein